MKPFKISLVAVTLFGFMGSAFAQAKVPKDLAAALVREIVQEYDQLYSDSPVMLDQLAAVKKHEADPEYFFQAEAIDLNKDGKTEFLIMMADVDEGLCTAHNCPVWAYSQNGNKYKLLLKGYGHAAAYDSLRALKTSKNGYADLQTYEHSSAVEMEVTTYRFNGKQYRPQKCFAEIYSGEGAKQKTKRKPHACGSD